MVGQRRGAGGGGQAGVAFAVEDPQRVFGGPPTVLGTQFVDTGDEVPAQSVEVVGSTDVVAHGVHRQAVAGESEGPVEAVGQGDDLDVEVGVGRPEDLDPHLVVLAVAPGLGRFVAEGRSGVPRLPGQRRSVLHPRPYQWSGALRPQGQGPAALVLELVHLLAHHVAALAGAPPEDLHVLEDRGVGQAVAGPLGVVGEQRQEGLPPGRLGPQDVVGPLRGARDLGLVGHGGQSFFPGRIRYTSYTASR